MHDFAVKTLGPKQVLLRLSTFGGRPSAELIHKENMFSPPGHARHADAFT